MKYSLWPHQQEGRAVAGNHRAMQALVQKACTLSSGSTVNRKNTKSLKLSANSEVVEKPLYKCTSEGQMHVAAWYHGTPGPPKFTKFGE